MRAPSTWDIWFTAVRQVWILTNVKSFVLPYIKRLKESRLSEKDHTLVRILDDQLNDIMPPLIVRLSNAHVLLTPQEMQVVTLVKDGRTTSEIIFNKRLP